MEAVRFTCQPGCTRCCDQKGFVYITENDLQRLARFLDMSVPEFEKQFVYRTKKQMRLRKPRGRQCRFLGAGGCQVHAVKPVQCRLFPFWPDLLESKRAWERTGKWCPGIGHGPLIQIGTALETASEMKRSYPEQY